MAKRINIEVRNIPDNGRFCHIRLEYENEEQLHELRVQTNPLGDGWELLDGYYYIYDVLLLIHKVQGKKFIESGLRFPYQAKILN